jgi:MFS family permease
MSKSPSHKDSIIRLLILPIYLPSILMAIGTGMILLVIPLMAAELSGGYAAASLIFAMFGAGTLASDLPAGVLVSRLGIKPAMFLGIVISTISAIVAGIISTALVLGCASFFLGVGRGLIMICRMTYIADTTNNERGRAMATVGGMMRVGALTGPIIGGLLAKFLGFSPTLIIAGIIIGSSIFFVGYLSSASSALQSIHRKNPFKAVGAILVQNRNIFMTAGTALIGLQLLRAVRVVIVPFWGNSIGLDIAEIGLITGTSMGLELLMFYPVGIAMDRYGRKWTAVPCIAILGFSFALIPLSYDFTSLLMVVLLAGLGNGLGSGIFLTMGADFSPEEDRSSFMGVWRLIGDSGHASGPFLVGLLTGVFSLALASLVASAIGLCSAAVMLFLVKESRYHSTANK